MKLLITLISAVILAIHMPPIGRLASAAAEAGPLDAGVHGAQTMMIIASGTAVAAMLTLTALSVYRPRGVTGFA